MATGMDRATGGVHSAWAARATLIGSSTLSGLALAGMVPVLPDIEANFAGTPEVGVLTKFVATIVGLAMVVVSPTVGWISRRTGRKRLLIAMFAVYAAAGAAGGLLDSLLAILLTRVAVGAATAVIAVLTLAIITDLYAPEERSRLLGMWVTVSSLGVIVITPLVGLLGEAGWRLPFSLHLLAVPFALMAVFAFRDIEPAGFAAPLQEASSRLKPVVVHDVKPARVLAGVALVLGILLLGSNVFLPFVLRDRSLYTPALAGLVGATPVVFTAVLAASFGRLAQQFGSRVLFAFGLALHAGGAVVLAFGPSLPWLVVGAALLGMGGGTITPTLYSEAGRAADPRDRANAIGLVKGLYGLGMFVGPLLLQPLADRGGTPGVFASCAGIAALLGIGIGFGALRTALAAPHQPMRRGNEPGL